MLRRTVLLIAAAALLFAAAVTSRSIAQDAPPAAGSAARVTTKIVIELSEKFVGEEELIEQFRKALKTEPGALVLRDRAGQYEERARAEAQADAIPNLFDELFEKIAAGFRLRDDQSDFRDQFLATSARFNRDVSELKSAMAAKAELIDRETDIDKLLHRFMMHETAPIILYVRQLRPQMRPGNQMLERVFADQLARRGDGRYVIRPESRARVEARLEKYDQRMKLLERAQLDLAEFADEVSPVDDLHVRFKGVLKDPLTAVRFAMPIFETDSVDRRAFDNIVNQFEGAVREGPEGLEIQDSARLNIERVLPDFERMREATDSIRAPLDQFVAMISDEDVLHRKLKQTMATDLMLVRTASQVRYATADVGAAIDRYFSSFLAEQDDGRLRVDTSNVSEEQLVGLVSTILREARMARRRGREATELTSEVTDPELREALMSPGGKIAFGDELRQRSIAAASDGLDQWLAAHFETTDRGYRMRDQSRGEIEDFVRQVNEVKQELSNADF